MHLMDFYNFCIDLVWSLFSFACVMKTKILNGSYCFQSLRNPLRLKYSCSSQSTWKLAVDSLMTVIRKGLNVALARPGTVT